MRLLAAVLAVVAGGVDDHGAGRLHDTRFAVPPAVAVYGDGSAVFARLTRDLPHASDGRFAAAFTVEGVGRGDPIGRTRAGRPCFQQTVAPARARPGQLVRVTLTTYTARDEPDGSLSTTVRLRAPEPPRAADDYRPAAEQTAVGC